MLLGDFVTDAPQDDAGVIAVAADQSGKVFFVPVGEEMGVVIAAGILGLEEAVEGLVHHEEAHAIGSLEPFGRGRIVAGAECVAAEALENFELSLDGASG